jgi:hypothetical protein
MRAREAALRLALSELDFLHWSWFSDLILLFDIVN